MAAHKATRIKTILATYLTREEAGLAEDKLILQQWEENKPLSLNASIRGEKFNTLGSKRTPEQIEISRKANLGRKKSKESIEAVTLANSQAYYLISPKGQIFEGINIRKFCRDNILIHPNIMAVINGESLHCKGWTTSTEAHNLYLEAFNDRGVTSNFGKYWRLQWCEEGTLKNKRFKSKAQAIQYRNELALKGIKWIIQATNWKKRLQEMIDCQIQFQN
jgi:hypothetical protein